MTTDPKNRKFKIEIFLIAFVFISVLTAISFIAFWAKDEGQIDEKSGLIKNLLADSFYFFRLPTHELFWNSILKENGSLFLPLLTINIMFWSILSERLIVITTKLIRARKLKR